MHGMTDEEWLASRGFTLRAGGQWSNGREWGNGGIVVWQDAAGEWWASVWMTIRHADTAAGALRETADAAWASLHPAVGAVNEARAILGR